MILELRDKIEIDDDMDDDIDTKLDRDEDEEAINGLMSLGYSRYEIEKTLRDIDTSKIGVEEIIRHTLRKLSKK